MPTICTTLNGKADIANLVSNTVLVDPDFILRSESVLQERSIAVMILTPESNSLKLVHVEKLPFIHGMATTRNPG